jgi:fucose permease
MMALALIVLGNVISLVGCIKFWVAAKSVSMGWFLGCLLIIAWPFFLIAHFSKAWKPFAICLVGLVIIEVGTVIRGN